MPAPSAYPIDTPKLFDNYLSHQPSPASRATARQASSASPSEAGEDCRAKAAQQRRRAGFCIVTARRGCSSMVEQQPSKLMTRVRFPSPAPTFSMTCVMLLMPFGQDGCRSFGQKSAFCSRGAAFLGPVHNLSRRSFGVLRQHLDRRVSTLRQHLAVGQFSVTAFGESAVSE